MNEVGGESLIRSLLLLLFHNRICTAQCVVVTASVSGDIHNKKRSGHIMRSLVSGILRRHIRQWGARGCHSTVTMTGSAMDPNTVFHLDRYSRLVKCTDIEGLVMTSLELFRSYGGGRKICSPAATRDNEHPKYSFI